MSPHPNPHLIQFTSGSTKSSRRRGRVLVLIGSVAVMLLLIAVGGALGAVITGTHTSAPAQPNRSIVPVPASAKVVPVVDLSVSPAIKPGPDGRLHDAFSVTDFYVHVGRPVVLVINNTDNMDHSITSPAAGVNIIAKPGTHAYKLLVTKAGRFAWHCIFPCDPWSMLRVGYMRGYIIAT